MKFMRFLLGLTIGAGVALLFAPKSGRDLREQLVGGEGGKLLSAAPDHHPVLEQERPWGSDSVTPTATVELPPPVVEEAPPVVEEAPPVVEEPSAPAVLDEEDLKLRIEETRAAVENEIAQPFVPVPRAEEAVAEAVVEEPLVEEAVAEEAAEAVVVEEVAEEAAAGEVVVEDEVVIQEPVAEGPELPEGPSAEPTVATTDPAAEDVGTEASHAWDIDYEGGGPAEAVVEESDADVAGVLAPPVEAQTPEPAVEPKPEPVVHPTPVQEPVVAEDATPEVAAEAPSGEPTEETVAPVALEPTPEETPGEEPPVREGATIDQAEMRRRIEETRARLKAKAFDAMMSGEAALLSRDSGEKPVPTGDDIDLDAETHSTIDESLSQEDY